MFSGPLLSIFLVGSCLTRVTASGSGLTGTPVTVTPFNRTHLSIDYKKSASLKDYSQLAKVFIDIKVSLIKKISRIFC